MAEEDNERRYLSIQKIFEENNEALYFMTYFHIQLIFSNLQVT